MLLLVSGGKKTAVGDSDYAAFAAKTEQSLEERIKNLLSGVAGVKNVRVLVTLDSFESRDASGGSGLLSLTGGMGSSVYLPSVRGVAVACDGGDQPMVRQRIVSLLSAALGVGENRISVAPA